MGLQDSVNQYKQQILALKELQIDSNNRVPLGETQLVTLSVLAAIALADAPVTSPDSGGAVKRRDFFIVANTKTFTLSAVPTTPGMSEVFVNGVKSVYSVDYTINGSQLVYTDELLPGYYLEIYYY